MNILITYLSLFTERNTEHSYFTNGFCSAEYIRGTQTNEPILRFLDTYLKDNGQKIGRIITILSYKVENDKCKPFPEKTTYEFFKGISEEVTGSDSVIFPVREYADADSLRETGAVIRDICGQITADDNIYIDTSGGTRTSANMLQLLAKILGYKGVRIAASYYSNINGNRAMIQTTRDFTELTDLADAVNEFVHTGRSYQLSECFKDETHKEIAELISCMNEFTDRMQLCNISELDDTLTNMRDCLGKVRMISSDETKIVILVNMLSVIEEKFFKGDSNGIDYCRMIKWCLENGLIQQAVTIYIEKIPKYIFDNEILICDKKYYEKTKEKNENNPLKQNTDAAIFFDEFMDSVSNASNSDVKSLQKAIDEKLIKYNKTYRYDKELFPYINTLFEIKKLSNDDFREYMLKVKDMSSSQVSKTEQIIAEYCVKQNISSFNALVKILSTQNIPILYEMMDKKNEKIGTVDKKINTASNITMKNYVHEGVKINSRTNINELRCIMFDYIYVKSVRNHINHASEEENLNDQQKKIFVDRGYNVNEFTTKAISKIIQESVERIEKAAQAVMKG